MFVKFHSSLRCNSSYMLTEILNEYVLNHILTHDITINIGQTRQFTAPEDPEDWTFIYKCKTSDLHSFPLCLEVSVSFLEMTDYQNHPVHVLYIKLCNWMRCW